MEETIVIFDSGMGGITALKEAMVQLPQEDFLYYGDTKNVPYGNQPPERIITYLEAVMERTAPYHPKALVLACNTATVSGAKYLREKYTLPIIGMEPAIKPALISPDNQDKRVLLLSTENTSRSEKLKNLIVNLDTEDRVDLLPLPNLVDFAEKLEFDTPEVREDLTALLSSYDFEEYKAVVLGCTHFIWFRELLCELLPPHIQLVDGNGGTIRQLKRKITPKLEEEDRQVTLYFSQSIDERKEHFLREYLQEPIHILEREEL